ncbi:hypothetical protein [Cyclobacterium xiamenense]|uniref:hypothetical protein n=1 Tax=Cyclobacterium xiamenense TaxID=1297121 RepID=UPI0035CF1C8D
MKRFRCDPARRVAAILTALPEYQAPGPVSNAVATWLAFPPFAKKGTTLRDSRSGEVGPLFDVHEQATRFRPFWLPICRSIRRYPN